MHIVIPETGIHGEPDIVDCSDGKQPVIIDIKTKDKLPSEAWFNDKLQLGVYVMGLERLGFKSKYGILKYELRHDRNQVAEFKVQVDDNLRRHIVDSTHDILRIINGGEPVLTDNERKCIRCEYRTTCNWSRAKDL